MSSEKRLSIKFERPTVSGFSLCLKSKPVELLFSQVPNLFYFLLHWFLEQSLSSADQWTPGSSLSVSLGGTRPGHKNLPKVTEGLHSLLSHWGSSLVYLVCVTSFQ